MAIDVVLGLQWGDEGKGKIVDFLAPNYDIVARFQGGPNAGHTLTFDDKKFVLHTVPSGIFRERQLNLIGNGVVLDPITLAGELKKLETANVDFLDRLLVARKAHLILPTHRYLDAASEHAKKKKKIGSTLKGIGPTYMDKTGRNGLRVGDLEAADFEDRYQFLKEKHLQLLKSYPAIDFDLEAEEKVWFECLEVLKKITFVDGEHFINQALRDGKKILAEGAQGTMLDIDFGTYPFVTSSNTTAAGVCTGLGVAPSQIGEVIGITKAYCTRVGSGPFPSELFDETGAFLRKEGAEFGATTGRERRCGWLDFPQLRYSVMLNGVTQLVVTKLDVLNKLETVEVVDSYKIAGEKVTQFPFSLNGIEVGTHLRSFAGWQKDIDGISDEKDLPANAAALIRAIEEETNVKVTIISTGPDRKELIVR